MDNIKTLTDIHLFADGLIYRFQVIPANMRITIDLNAFDYYGIHSAMENLPNIVKNETGYHANNGRIDYRYEGIHFKIKLKSL